MGADGVQKINLPENAGENASTRNEYHPALCNAMELELLPDSGLLEFRKSIKMNTLPREIDFLVIRKVKNGPVKNELAKFFRKCNIWEFKGYRGQLNSKVYHKTMSYAYEYLASNDDVDSISDVTLSFLREGRPRDLMKWLEKEGYKRQASPEWVIRYRKYGCPDLQIVNIAHPEAPLFLRMVSHKVKDKDIRDFSEQVKQLPDDQQEKARLIVELSFRINRNKIGGEDMGGFFETYVDPLKKVIEEKDAEMKQKDAEMKQKDAEIKKRDAQMKKKDSQMKKKDAQIKKKDELIEKMAAEIRRLGGNVAAL